MGCNPIYIRPYSRLYRTRRFLFDFEVSVPQAWVGKSIAEIDIRRKYNVNIIATKKSGKINAVVTADTVLSEEETLLVLGGYKALRKCFDI